MIETLANVLSFLEVDSQYFIISAGNDTLILTSDIAGPRNIGISDGTYSGSELATALQTALNADSTITGAGTITFSVSYSTTTYKFTINAGALHTIAYTHTGSDAGLTFGFTAIHAAAQTITSNIASGDPTSIVSTILSETEKYISNYCRRTFESTAYSLEKYNGKGYSVINLKQYPVTIVDRVAVGTRDAIYIKNTSTSTTASVSVTSTLIRLVKDGVADETVTFAANTTITAIVTAINLLGSGWSATIADSSFASFKSTELVTRSAAGCIDSQVIYLQIPNESKGEIEVDLNRGQIMLNGSFPSGFQNIFVDYTAGYSEADMPDDLKLAVKITIQYLYEKMKNTIFGVEFYNIGASGATGLRTIFEKGVIMPKEAERILSEYKSWRV